VYVCTFFLPVAEEGFDGAAFGGGVEGGLGVGLVGGLCLGVWVCGGVGGGGG
jgi:hypothetical protein